MLELITQLSAEIAEMRLLADEADDQLMVAAFAMKQLIDELQLLHDRLLDEPRLLVGEMPWWHEWKQSSENGRRSRSL